MRDDLHNDTYRVAIAPIAVADNTVQVGFWIDTSGYQSLTFGIITGNLADADATFAVQMEEADALDQSDAAAVADGDMISQTSGVAPKSAAAFTFANDNVARKIGYIGNKRFARLTVTPSANSGSAPIAAFADLSYADVRPAA